MYVMSMAIKPSVKPCPRHAACVASSLLPRCCCYVCCISACSCCTPKLVITGIPHGFPFKALKGQAFVQSLQYGARGLEADMELPRSQKNLCLEAKETAPLSTKELGKNIFPQLVSSFDFFGCFRKESASSPCERCMFMPRTATATPTTVKTMPHKPNRIAAMH